MTTSYQQDYFKQALQLFNNKKYDQAYLLFNKCLKYSPDNISLYYYIGRIHFFKKNYNTATDFFKIAFNSDTKNINYAYYYGRTLLFCKDYKNSINILSQIETALPVVNFFIGIALFRISDYNRAISALDMTPEVLKNKKQFQLIYSAVAYNIGINEYISKNFDNAANLFKKSISANSKFYPAYFQLGSLYIETAKYSMAITLFEYLKNKYKNEIINITLTYLYNITDRTVSLENIINESMFTSAGKINKENFSTILAYTLIRNRKYKEAIPILLQLYNKNHYDEMTLYYLSLARYNTGDKKRAENCYKIIYSITEKNPIINNSYILNLINSGEYSKAFRKSEYFIKNNGGDIKTNLLKYYSGIFSGEIKNFNKLFNTLSSKFNKNPLFIEATAKYYRSTVCDIDKATTYYYELYNLQPDDNYTINSLIELFTEREMKHQALYYLSKMYDKQKDNPDIGYYYGYYLIRTGNCKKAIEVLNKIEVNKYKAFHLIGQAYFVSGNMKDGTLFVKKSFELNPLYQPVLYRMLTLFYKAGKHHKALKICKLIEKCSPSFYRVHLYKMVIYSAMSRFDLAIESLKKYSISGKGKLHPYLKFIWFVLNYNEGRTDKLIKLIISDMRLNGRNAPEQALLAMCYKKKYAIEKQLSTEKNLIKEFGTSQSTISYINRFIKINKLEQKRKDIGIRFIY